MLYYVFTVDGDWKEYFDVKLSEEERAPRKKLIQELVKREIDVAESRLKGRFVHFIHASPRARTFFLDEPFMKLWKHIIEKGGSVGVHCHEDDPHKAYYFQDIPRMKEAISEQVRALRGAGLEVQAYRAGYLAFCAGLVKILEENGLRFDFSCEPGRYLIHNGRLVSDWRGAPTSLYRMSYHDHRKEGNSKVFEIPIGTADGHYFYFEKSGTEELKLAASSLKSKSEKTSRDIIVSVLTHSNEYAKDEDIKRIKEKITLLKQYGRFVGLKEVSDMI